jgi:hypothetical protein
MEVHMGRSTLNTTGESAAVVRKGHGTGALGPSDSSDSGSDIVGGPGLNRDGGLPLQRGTTSDPDEDPKGATAGPDIGDADLDSDSDRYGTGERGAVGRDSTEAIDETLTERDAGDIESDDPPDQDVEAAESVAKRRGINGATRRRPR